MVVETCGRPPGVAGGCTRGTPAPTARMHACGGLITAEKEVMPNMPKLETENEPPWNSSGCSLCVYHVSRGKGGGGGGSVGAGDRKAEQRV